MAELAHCITVFYMQELGICFADTGILVWHLFFRTFEAIASSFNLRVKLVTKVLYCFVLLNVMARKG